MLKTRVLEYCLKDSHNIEYDINCVLAEGVPPDAHLVRQSLWKSKH